MLQSIKTLWLSNTRVPVLAPEALAEAAYKVLLTLSGMELIGGYQSVVRGLDE